MSMLLVVSMLMGLGVPCLAAQSSDRSPQIIFFGKVWLDIIKQKEGSSASLLYFLNAERGHGRRGHVLSCCKKREEVGSFVKI